MTSQTVIPQTCALCPLSLTRNLVVSPEWPSLGEPPLLLVLGRDPGEVEDGTGRPLHPDAPAGGLLRKTLASLGLPLDRMVWDNVVHCHTPKNRGPRADEVAACHVWVQLVLRHYRLMGGKYVALLGQEATEAVLAGQYKPKKPEYPIAEWHGRIAEVAGLTYFPMYHPSGALRGGKTRAGFMADCRKLAGLMGVGYAEPPSKRCFGWPNLVPGQLVALDTESHHTTGELMGFAVAWRDRECGEVLTCWAYAHERLALGFLLGTGGPQPRIVAHNAKYEFNTLPELSGLVIDDTEMMAYVLGRKDTIGSLGLKVLALTELGYSWAGMEELGWPEEMEADDLVQYCCNDAAATFYLAEKYLKELEGVEDGRGVSGPA